ncbi:MAG TPA: Hsp70 family protein, partial [Pirellulales bacterium]|nr:Hsp70 family protein [Pirellulales bacterium]
MTASPGPAVGIDLGTTFSAVARLDDTGRPVTVSNAEGDLTTPSVVLFDGDDVVVGKEAVKAIATEAERVADCAKRDMGSREYRRTVDNKRYPPEVLQAYVLKKLREDT